MAGFCDDLFNLHCKTAIKLNKKIIIILKGNKNTGWLHTPKLIFSQSIWYIYTYIFLLPFFLAKTFNIFFLAKTFYIFTVTQQRLDPGFGPVTPMCAPPYVIESCARHIHFCAMLVSPKQTNLCSTLH